MIAFRFLLVALVFLFPLSAQDDFAAAHPLKKDGVAPLKGDMIRLTDYGTDDVAYLTLPPTAPIGGVILVHEWWGLNDYIKATADRLAAEGFIVVAVDLYNGEVATDPTRAADLMNNLNHALAVKTIGAACNFLHQSPRFHCDRVGVMGWCMGGGLSLQAAIEVKDLSAAVIYYGPLETEEKKVNKLRIPILGIFGQQDKWVKPEDVHTFDDLLTKLGKAHEFHTFDAVHAFANPSNADYRADYAAQAWDLSTTFLKRELNGPAPKKNVIDKLFNN